MSIITEKNKMLLTKCVYILRLFTLTTILQSTSCQWILLKQELNYQTCDDYFSQARTVSRWTAQSHSTNQDIALTSCIKSCDVQSSSQFKALYFQDYNLLRLIRLDFPHCRIKIDVELVKIDNWDSSTLQSSYVQFWLEEQSIYKWDYLDIFDSGSSVLCLGSVQNDYIKSITFDIPHQTISPDKQLLKITHPNRGIGLKSFSISYMPCHESCGSCVGPKPTECQSCSDSTLVLLPTGECIQQNCGTGNVCVQCFESYCLSCLDAYPNACTKCTSGWFLEQGSCKIKCRDGFYGDSLDNNICKRCVVGCAICIGSSSNCTTCEFGYTLQGNSCIKNITNTCGVGSYQDENGICHFCPTNCAECFGSSITSICYTCNPNTYLLGTGCFSQCPTGFYNSPHEQVCTQCSNGCDECTSYSTCTKCNQFMTPSVYLSSGYCVSLCPEGMIGDTSNSTCVQCGVTNCSQCSNAVTCTQCRQGYYLNNSTNPNKCIQFCGSPATNCTDVHSSCPTTQVYDYRSQICRACPQNCSLCDEDGRCFLCQSNTPPFNLINNLCTNSACNSNQYFDGIQCKNCSERCNKCYSATICLECKSQYIAINNSCVLEKCTSGYYYDYKTDTCIQCSGECTICSSTTICQSCVQGYQLQDYTCVSICVVGQYYDTNTSSCLPCPQYCTKCNQFQVCSSCSSGSTLYYNQYCYPTCQANQYFSTQLKKCDNCLLGCQTCTQSDICITCLTGFVKDNANKCIKDCGAAKYFNQITLQCDPCPIYCQTCQSTAYCSSCITGNYTIKNNLCISCDCNYPNQIFDQITQVCVICDQNCIQCKSTSQCQKCSSDYTVDVNGKCSKGISIEYYVTTQVDQEIKVFIHLSRNILMRNQNYKISQFFTIEISDISSSEYSYSMTLSNDSSTISIIITTSSTIKNKTITVYAQNRDQITDQFTQTGVINQTKYETPLGNYYPVSDSTKQNADSLSQVGQVVSATMLAGVVPLALVGYFSALANFLDITQLIQYLYYVDVRYPYNLVEYFKIFQNFDLDFLPNVFIASYPPDFHKSGQNSPPAFNKNGKSALFLDNAGENFFVLIIILGCHLVVRFLKFALINSQEEKERLMGRVLAQMCQFFEFNAYIIAMFEIFFNLMVSCFLQVWDMPTDQSFELLSVFLVIISLIGSLSYVVFAWIFLKKQNLESLEHNESKYGELWKSLRIEEKVINKYYFVCLFVRKFLFALFIVALYEATYVQLSMICLLNIGLIIYIKSNKPLHLRVSNIVEIITEFLLIVVQILIMILKKDPDDQIEEERINIGWAIILIIALILALQICIAFYEIYLGIKQYLIQRQQNIKLEDQDSHPQYIEAQSVSIMQNVSSISAQSKQISRASYLTNSDQLSKVYPINQNNNNNNNSNYNDSRVPIEVELFSPQRSSSSRHYDLSVIT